ncbi:MAG: sigma factor [Aureliella sp.]
MSQQNSKIDPSKWLDTHGDVLYAYAVSRLRNQEAAEEAVQETFLGALRNQATHAGQSSEGAWLMGILKKEVVDNAPRNHDGIPFIHVVSPASKSTYVQTQSADNQ